MGRFSRRLLDLDQFYTKQILLDTLTSRMKLIKNNQKQTEYTFLCPFHKEKTASFKMYKNKEGWWGFKCLGCGRAGNVFTFLMNFERWSFWEALVHLKINYRDRALFPLGKVYRNPNQLRLPFPVDEQGNFIWVSPDMKQLGFV